MSSEGALKKLANDKVEYMFRQSPNDGKIYLTVLRDGKALHYPVVLVRGEQLMIGGSPSNPVGWSVHSNGNVADQVNNIVKTIQSSASTPKLPDESKRLSEDIAGIREKLNEVFGVQDSNAGQRYFQRRGDAERAFAAHPDIPVLYLSSDKGVLVKISQVTIGCETRKQEIEFTLGDLKTMDMNVFKEQCSDPLDKLTLKLGEMNNAVRECFVNQNLGEKQKKWRDIHKNVSGRPVYLSNGCAGKTKENLADQFIEKTRDLSINVSNDKMSILKSLYELIDASKDKSTFAGVFKRQGKLEKNLKALLDDPRFVDVFPKEMQNFARKEYEESKNKPVHSAPKRGS